MANKYWRPGEIGQYLKKLQGERTDTQFALDTKVGRPILHRIRTGRYLPTRAVLAKLGLEFAYREIEAGPARRRTPVPPKRRTRSMTER